MSHIFPINNVDEDKCVTKLLGNEDDKRIVHDSMYEGVNIKRASTEALIFCKDVSDVSASKMAQVETKRSDNLLIAKGWNI